MAHLNHKGPENKGSQTGRKLGLCKNKLTKLESAEIKKLGKGQGKRRHNLNCKESGKRLNSGKYISAKC